MQATKETEVPNVEYMPKPLTRRQNLIMTVKVLAGVGIMLGLLWLASTTGARP